MGLAKIPAETARLQSTTVSTVRADWMVGATGIEPVTPSMSTRCSPLSRLWLDRKIVEDQLLTQLTILS
jgi:hypothetical protein